MAPIAAPAPTPIADFMNLRRSFITVSCSIPALSHQFKSQHFPDPRGQSLSHPLKSEVVRMRAIHQSVAPGWAQKIGALHDLQMGVARRNPPRGGLPDQLP